MEEEAKEPKLKEKYPLKEILRDAVTGVIMGIANIIPGVSGGTMAVVTGIYDKVIALFTLEKGFIKRNWRFVCVLVLGILVGIFGFAGVMDFLLENYPVATNAFFIGVVVGTLPFIFKRTGGGGLPARVIPCVVTVALMVLMTVAKANLDEAAVGAYYTEHTFGNALILGGTMILTAACMVIPGISGSFVGLALGVYPSIIKVLKSFDWLLLLPIAVGALLGLWGGSKLIRFLLRRFKPATYSAILGLLIGSVFVLVYPLIPQITLSVELFVAIATLAGGVVVAWLFARSDKE